MKHRIVLAIIASVTVLVLLVSHPARLVADSDADSFRGRTAPAFELKVVGGNGRTVKLSDLKGKAVVLNFWATWCGPCKVEMPWLIEFQKKYASQGLQVVGVAMDDPIDDAAISSFTRKMDVNYPILAGNDQVADLYGGVDALPELFFIDPSGKIVSHSMGLGSKSELEEKIKSALAPSTPVRLAAK